MKNVTGRRVIGPTSFHPSYVAARKARHPCLTLQRGIEALKADARGVDELGDVLDSNYKGPKLPGVGGRMFIWPQTAEETVTSDGLTKSRYQSRIDGMRLDNVFAECVRTNAAMPFNSSVQVSGVLPKIVSRMMGADGGVDGMGGSVTDFYRVVFENKLFAGIHFIRLDSNTGVPVWRHVYADEFLDWSYVYEDGRIKLLACNIHVSDGHRLVYNTLDNGKVEWKQYAYNSETKEWGLLSKGVRTTDTVPVVPFYTSWGVPYESPPPFKDAASSQVSATRARSLNDSLRDKICMADFMAITGAGSLVDEDGVVGPIPRKGNVIILTDEKSGIEWISVDPKHLSAVSKDIDEQLDGVRRQCLDPMRAKIDGEVKALEVDLHSKRSSTFIEALVNSDMASLRTAIAMTVEMLGGVVSDDFSVDMDASFDLSKNKETSEKLLSLAEKGFIPVEMYLEFLQESDPNMPRDLFERHITPEFLGSARVRPGGAESP